MSLSLGSGTRLGPYEILAALGAGGKGEVYRAKDDAIEPFWSPDSRSIAFGGQGKLKRIDLGATRAQPLADAARLNNGVESFGRHRLQP